MGSRTVAGFYTEEIRHVGQRVGFRLITFDGGNEVMAHIDFPKARRVGRYGVDVEAIDRAACDALSLERDAQIYVVDEIGKMECFSTTFIEAMQQLLDSHRTVVASVALRGGGFIAHVKRRPDVQLWEVTRGTRDALGETVIAWLERRC